MPGTGAAAKPKTDPAIYGLKEATSTTESSVCKALGTRAKKSLRFARSTRSERPSLKSSMKLDASASIRSLGLNRPLKTNVLDGNKQYSQRAEQQGSRRPSGCSGRYVLVLLTPVGLVQKTNRPNLFIGYASALRPSRTALSSETGHLDLHRRPSSPLARLTNSASR